MSEFRLTTPVVMIIFKKLDTTKRVFEKVRAAAPNKLYVISDAPRKYVEGEDEKVQEVRKYIDSHIDWDCEVIRDYAEQNMGCGKRIASGLDRVFQNEEQAIILEDDCVPHDTFFRYCQEMLEHYKDDNRVLMIGGNNPVEQLYDTKEDYIFSRVPFMWGWATWKRSWNLYDYKLSTWPQNRKNPLIAQAIPNKRARCFYTTEFEVLHQGKYDDVWDYQFMYVGIMNNMFGILPSKSHVENVGFVEDATHTYDMPDWINRNVTPVNFPIKYREDVIWDKTFDEIYMEKVTRQGYIVKLKQLLGLDINKSIFDSLKKRY